MSTPTPTPRPALKATGMRRRHARCLETELAALWARAERAEAERDSIKQEIEMVEHRAYRAEVERDQLRAEVERLRAGIAECLHTNGHLADGEDCTLIGLKRCFNNPTAARESNGGAA